MFTYVFFGVVYPERALIDLHPPISFDMENPELAFSGKAHLAIYKNQIIIKVETEAKINDIYTRRNLIKDAAQTVLDIAGMEMALAYTADIRSVSGPEGYVEVFGIGIGELGIGNNESRTIDIHQDFFSAGSDPYLRRALADVRSAIAYPVDTGFFCYRAVESLINATLEATGKTNKLDGISALETNLNIDPSCVEKLRKLGGDARHGKIVSITSQERVVAVAATREILRRYMKRTQGDKEVWSLLKP